MSLLPVPLFNSFIIDAPYKIRERGEKLLAQLEANKGPANGEYISLEKEGPRSRVLTVPSQNRNGEYVVGFSWNKSGLSARCSCPAAEDALICKHMVAATLFLLKDAAEKPDTPEAATETAPKSAAPQKPRQEERPREIQKMQRSSRPRHFVQELLGWSQYYRQAEIDKITPLEKQGQEGRWEFRYQAGKKTFHYPAITYDRKELFTLFCTCETAGICAHTKAAVAWLRHRFSDKYFTTFRNYDAEKAELFHRLNIAPDDPIAADIIFEVDNWDRLVARLPEWLIPAQNVAHQLAQVSSQLGIVLPPAPSPMPDTLSLPKEIEPGMVLLTKPTAMPLGLELIPVNRAKGKFSRLNWSNETHKEDLRRAIPPEVFQALENISIEGLNHELRLLNTHINLPADTNAIRHYSGVLAQLRTHYYKNLQQLWPWLSTLPEGAVSTTDNARISAQNITPVSLFPSPLHGSLSLSKEGKYLALRIVWKSENGEPVTERLTPQDGLLLQGEKTWYLPAATKDLRLMEALPHGRLLLPQTALEQVLRTTIAQFSTEYDVEIAESLRPKAIHPHFEPLLHLTEVGRKHLALIPQFRYGKETFPYEASPRPMLFKNAAGTLEELLRDPAKEAAFVGKIADLHPEFHSQRGRAFYTLPFQQALEQSWYQHTLAALETEGIAVTGIPDLEHFRYNANAAEVRVSEGSNKTGGEIDWFDLLIEVSFGDQQVSLKEVRRALINGQAGVRLPDGTIGLLPTDFVEQYGPLLRLGTENKNGSLRVSKLHFTLIDQLHEAALSADLRAELAEKKRKLANIGSVTTAPVPETIQAQLRPYQLAGYQWLQVLDEMGWGGCLADDMGLGKTLQTITFLQWLQEKKPGAQSLVVCPTSLIYNWQSELEKFAPNLRYHTHYGANRTWDEAAPPTADVVITTYGTVRSDIEKLSKVSWHYVILDESQAIKNPDAQTTKAVQLLPAKNRICLSGTPLQNNTFDLYAQFQFLNPGLLGSREMFRTDFANPIDKYGEEAPRTLLRKMLAPFMMRRTKTQVAPDLPDKTEMVLWCEMEAEQRAVYDEYRRYYRDSLLQRIDKDGMAGSAIQVLEALLRLRQLCDHPALVKNKAVETNESVKIEELRRELTENVGGKKVLVFSQFTEMLALIAADFDRTGISFTYLDGSTPAAQRAAAVERFQTDPSVQVFLISLKAGGVGLNLTAAEYVYIVDPWWNPAVEAQAIDRTHRIGQQNKIVAYRMICKDTVEEKVLQLQSRKKALADGLVTEDAGFIKKLTRDDVAFLLE